jgi:sugar (pentulose or hexulose) kinase
MMTGCHLDRRAAAGPSGCGQHLGNIGQREHQALTMSPHPFPGNIADCGSPLFLGLDFGTSSLKVACLDKTGDVSAVVKKPMLTRLSNGLRAEQDPIMWWAALCEATNEVLASDSGLRKRIAAIGLCATTSTVVPCDSNFVPMGPAIMWLDGRAFDEASAIGAHQPKWESEEVSPQHLVSKVLWLKRKSPELLDGHLLEAVSWLTYKLAGRLVVPKTIPSFTWGIRPENWNELGPLADDLLSCAAAVRTDTVGPTEVVSTLTTAAARQTGLLPGTLVIAAGNDGLLAATGAGLYIGDSVIEVGGTGYTVWSRSLRDKGGLSIESSCAKPDPLIDETVISVSDLGEVGLFLRWLRSLLRINEKSFDSLCRRLMNKALAGNYTASNVRVSTTLLRTDRGGSSGASLSVLHASTQGSDLIQAALEDLAVSASDAARRHCADGSSGRQVILTGGISSNPLYRLLRSSAGSCQDVYGTATPDTGAVGAAMCAACAAGEYSNIQTASVAMLRAPQKLGGSSAVALALRRD